MKTNDPIVRKRMKWIGMILLAVVAALGFSYLYTRGVSPVWAAVAIDVSLASSDLYTRLPAS